MIFTVKQALLVSSIGALLGIFLGLLIRLVREKVELHRIFRGFTLCCKFLIIYPLIFPVVVLLNKETFAHFLIDIVMKKYKIEKLSKKKAEKLREKILEKLTVNQVISIWVEFLRNSIKSYDEFVRCNIQLAKNILQKEDVILQCKSNTTRNMECIISDYVELDSEEPEVKSILDYPDKITENEIGFFGLFINYEVGKKVKFGIA